MKKLIFLLVALFTFLNSNALIREKVFASDAFGRTFNVAIYTPDGVTPSNMPVFIFIPGNNEVGTDVNKLYVNGPLLFVKNNNWKPNFMIVAIQGKNLWPSGSLIRITIDSLIQRNYGINPEKIVLSGLSAGAACIFDYVKTTPNNLYKKPSAIIPMSITIGTQCGDFYAGTDVLCGTDLRFGDFASWGFCGSNDSHYEKMNRFWLRLSQAGYVSKFTSSNTGHCCWNTHYNPSYKENNLNIYDWGFQFPLNNLPVMFGEFKGSYRNSVTNLSWVTYSEQNNSHFIIEKSVDGGATYQQVGKVDTKATNGNSDVKTKYNFEFKK